MMNNELHIPNEIRALNSIPVLRNRLWGVGGACRDHWLGRTPKDFDLVTTATPEELTSLGFTLAHTSAPVFITKCGDELVEIACTRREIQEGTTSEDFRFETGVTLEEDLKRRDFTCNAIAFHIGTGCWDDPNNGITDIQDKELRIVDVNNFVQSPERILRAFMHISRFGFRLSPKCFLTLRLFASDVKHIPVEQVWKQGFKKLLTGNDWKEALSEMAHCGVAQHLGLNFEGFKCELNLWESEINVEARVLALVVNCDERTVRRMEELQFLSDTPNWKKKLKVFRRVAEVVRSDLAEPLEMTRAQLANRRVTEFGFDAKFLFLGAMSFDTENTKDRNALAMAVHKAWANRQPDMVTSRDLLELGLEPGPLFGKTLKVARFLQDMEVLT